MTPTGPRSRFLDRAMYRKHSLVDTQRRSSNVHDILFGGGVRKPVQNFSLGSPKKLE
jgi:hypothetical protein